MNKLKPHQLAQAGATDGQTLVWDSTAGMWVPGDGGGSATSLVPLTTMTGSDPEFVWDDNDELVLTEVVL